MIMGTALLSENDIREIDREGRVQDLRLAWALGFSKPENIRKLIGSFKTELADQGIVYVAKTIPVGPGRPGIEYWLNEAQALIICMRSDAPNAAIIRAEIAQVFMAWRRGSLSPQSMAPIAIEQIGDLFDAKLAPIRADIISLRNEIAQRVGRRDFPPQVVRVWIHVIAHAYKGLCPTGCEISIVDRHGHPTSVFSCDHWFRPDRIKATDGWPVAIACNQRLYTDPMFKSGQLSRFMFFQELMKIHCPSGVMPIPVIESKADDNTEEIKEAKDWTQTGFDF